LIAVTGLVGFGQAKRFEVADLLPRWGKELVSVVGNKYVHKEGAVGLSRFVRVSKTGYQEHFHELSAPRNLLRVCRPLKFLGKRFNLSGQQEQSNMISVEGEGEPVRFAIYLPVINQPAEWVPINKSWVVRLYHQMREDGSIYRGGISTVCDRNNVFPYMSTTSVEGQRFGHFYGVSYPNPWTVRNGKLFIRLLNLFLHNPELSLHSRQLRECNYGVADNGGSDNGIKQQFANCLVWSLLWFSGFAMFAYSWVCICRGKDGIKYVALWLVGAIIQGWAVRMIIHRWLGI
jgi:hypothetical protein